MLLVNKDHRKLVENFFSLSFLNVINYLFPIILIPYLTRILGAEKFGLYAFSFSIIQYLALLINYGFDYSATKYVAINRDDIEKISETFCSIILIRIVFAIITVLLLVFAALLFEKIGDEYLLYFYGIGILLGQSLTPIWLFQGMEQMKFVTIINFCSKLTTMILVFLFLKNQSDYVYINLYYSFGFLIAGILSLILAIRIFKIRLSIPKFHIIKGQIKDGWHLFLSTVFMNFYRESNIIILGSFANYTVVGYYAVAEKIIKAVQSLISPVTTALFPYFGRNLNIKEKRTEFMKKFYRFLKIYSSVLLLIVLCSFILSDFAIKIYLGPDFIPSALDMKIMSSVILFGGLNYLLGIVGLVNLGFEKQFTRSVFIAGVVSILSCFVLVNLFSDIGASITLVIAEVLLFVMITKQFVIRKLYILN